MKKKMPLHLKQVTLQKQIIAVGIFIAVILIGLFIPILIGQLDLVLPIESVMLIAALLISTFIIFGTSLKWNDIFESIIKSISSGLPGSLILLVIGPLIAAFIISGLIPMLIYYGIATINLKFIYAISFLLPAIFSTFTGTSWGSAATIGVVMIGIGHAVGANIPIIAGAVIGGAYFGDKMSPLSDTTNIAAIASNVNLYDHIASMMWTTIPSSFLALIIYLICGFIFPAKVSSINDPTIITLMTDLKSIFNFNPLLLIPLLVVLIGSATKRPVFPVMILGALSGFIMALLFQRFTLTNIISSLNSGFKLSMITWYEYSIPMEGHPYILGFFQRGGIWELGTTMVIGIMILGVVGILNSINAMPAVANAIFGWVKSRHSIIISSLATAIAMIGLTANGMACSFITADIFRSKYDDNTIDRRVLSRTTEDAGTLLEVLFPWTPAAIFFVRTLGVSVGEYLPWAIMNWSTSIIAIILAITGIGTYKRIKKQGI